MVVVVVVVIVMVMVMLEQMVDMDPLNHARVITTDRRTEGPRGRKRKQTDKKRDRQTDRQTDTRKKRHETS